MLRIILWAALLAGVGAGIGLGIAKFTTPVYEARTALLAGGGAADPAAARGEALTMLKSPALFQHAVDFAAKSHPELNSKREAVLLPSHDATQGEGGKALEFRVQSPDPKIAADVANSVVSTYNDQAQKSNSAAASDKRTSLQSQITVAKSRLDATQKLIEAQKERWGVDNIDADIVNAANYQANLLQQRDDTQNKLQALKRKLTDEEARYKTLAPTTTGPITEVSSPKLTADMLKLQQLQAQKVELSATWLPTSQKMRDMDIQIKGQEDLVAKDKLEALQVERKETTPNPARQELERQIMADSAQSESLTASLSEVGKAQARQKADTRRLPAQEARMLDLVRERDLADQKYKALRASADSLDVNGSATQLPLLSTFLTAEPPRVPVWPDTNLMISVGAAIGLILGIMVGVSTTARAEEYDLGPQLPSGPSLPELPAGTVAAPPLPARRGGPLAALASPAAAPAEAYRFMVFSMLSGREDSARTVLFTGVTSDLLCSEAAAQFAIAASQSGVRTLLADCNLRHHGLTEAFGFKGKSGISDMLSRTMLPTGDGDLILPTEHPDLYFMPSGSEEGEGLGSYANLQITGLVQDLKERADVKVLNLPACAVVADAPRLVRFADNVCLVASKADRSRGLLVKAQEILRRAGAAEVEVLVIDRDESSHSFLG
ncbi:MAG TPA: hypothetical protein VKT78_20955 [Fimbriimonadaceae bacterium]|nr:hypothetical protein [Fimbriimonadaceae bacterium]